MSHALIPPSPTEGVIEVGVDEAGRGCLSHSVVAGACILPQNIDMSHPLTSLIRDSKKLSEPKRKQVCDYIKEIAVAYATGEATPAEIDEINILQATFLAMHRALDVVREKVEFTKIFVDGPHFKQYHAIQSQCVCSGDALYMNIAAASILAKCKRDELVIQSVASDPRLEHYGFEQHKGYGTKKHLDALKAFGASEHHRRTFGPVKCIQ